MQAIIASFSLLTGLLLVLASFFWRSRPNDKGPGGRTSSFLFAAGGLLFLITGLMMLTDPLEFITGNIVTTTENTTGNITDFVTTITATETLVLTTMNVLLNRALGTTLLLAGVFGVWTGLRGRNDDDEAEFADEFNNQEFDTELSPQLRNL